MHSGWARTLVALGLTLLLLSTSVAAAADINWKQFSGQTIAVALVKHPFTEALIPLIRQFTEKTGISISFIVLPEAEYWEKLTIDLSTGAGTYDVFMTGPSVEWQQATAGWLEPLNPYLNNPSLTSPSYDVDDFYPAILGANAWNKQIGTGVGQGTQWAIPVMVETTILAYRKDLFEKKGIKVPETLDELYSAAKALTGVIDGQQIYGIAQRGNRDISSTQMGWIYTFKSFGGVESDPNLRSLVNSEAGVKAAEFWTRLARDAGSPGWPNMTWYDAMQGFAAGKFSMILDCDFFAYTYENPNTSAVAGKVGYALPPVGPAGRISNIWTWALAMNAKSRNKGAAWYFIQWATSKERLKASALRGNLNAVRRSVFMDPDVVAMTEKWDNGNWRRVASQMLERYARLVYRPNTELVAEHLRWLDALHEIYYGRPAKEALDAAAQDMTRINQQAFK
ncbi:MAG: sugar ABC transporter substrate-binding protein [Limnochordaceae bacterium]|nr:sugar ABC transporter substrate-binding protein [Limnochordaceae bacterium]